VTFLEGWTARQMASQLEATWCLPCPPISCLPWRKKNARDSFSRTRTFFEQGLAASAIGDRLVERFREKVRRIFKEQARAMKLSYGQLVTLASIVERSARRPGATLIGRGVL